MNGQETEMNTLVPVCLSPPAKIYVISDLGPVDLPGVSRIKPIVGLFDLPSVTDLLIKNAEFIPDAVADRLNIQRRKRVHTACSKPAQAAVAGYLLSLQFEDDVQIQARFFLKTIGLRPEPSLFINS